MRRLWACGLAALLLAPAWPAGAEVSEAGEANAAAASAKLRRHKCRRLTKQIRHFEGVADMASDRRDRLWLDATEAHVRRLEQERIDLCPEFERPSPLVRFGKGTTKWLKRAARVAATYFTGGAF